VRETLWAQVPTDLFGVLLPNVEVFTRRTSDGELRAVRSHDERGRWRLAVTHTRKRRPRRERVPTWYELSEARWELLPERVTVVLPIDVSDRTTLTLIEL
jgi:hypothetical protein